MAYRRTANVIRRLNARHDAIVDAARAAATAGGMAAIQIAPVAARAGVAAGTVYRYFPGKIELVGALVESVADREIEAVRRAGDAAPGPLSALAAVIATFAARALARPQARLGRDRRAGRHRNRRDASAVSQDAGRRDRERASAPRSTAAICRNRTPVSRPRRWSAPCSKG